MHYITMKLIGLLAVLALVASACASSSTDTSEPDTTTTTGAQSGQETPTTTTAPATTTTEAAPEPVTLNIMHNWGPEDAKGEAMQAAFAGFMAEYPYIEIKDEILSDNDITTKVETAFLAGQEPDIIFQGVNSSTREWKGKGVTVDVAQFVDEWDILPLTEFGLGENTLDDGTIVAFPFEGFTWPIWFNTEILAEAGVDGVPTTFDELLDTVAKLKAADLPTMVVGGTDWTGVAAFDLIMSSSVSREELLEVYVDGAPWDANPNVVRAVERFVEIRDAGLFTDVSNGLDFPGMNEDFFAERASFMHGGAWTFGETPEDLAANVTLGGFPVLEGVYDSPLIFSGFGAKGVFVSRNGSAKLDAVQKFIEFFFRPATVERFVVDSGMLPPIEVNPDPALLDALTVQTLSFDVSSVATLNGLIEPDTKSERSGAVTFYYDKSNSAEDIIALMNEIWGNG